MLKDFLILAFTHPELLYPDLRDIDDALKKEASRLSELLLSGEVDILHLRKPTWDSEVTSRLIEKIPIALRSRVTIHDHFHLIERFGLGGAHLNTRNPIPPACRIKRLSRSFHSLAELQKYEQVEALKHYDYVTLSPIFDSISKIGYRSCFSLREIAPFIKGKKVVALGGVTPDKIPELKNAGFSGAAMLGYFWKLNN